MLNQFNLKSFRGLTFTHIDTKDNKKIQDAMQTIRDVLLAYLENGQTINSILEKINNEPSTSEIKQDSLRLLNIISQTITPAAQAALAIYNQEDKEQRNPLILMQALRELNGVINDYVYELNKFNTKYKGTAFADYLRRIGAASAREIGASQQPFSSQARLTSVLKELSELIQKQDAANLSVKRIFNDGFEKLHGENKATCDAVAVAEDIRKINEWSAVQARRHYQLREGYRRVAKDHLDSLSQDLRRDDSTVQIRSQASMFRTNRSNRDFIVSYQDENVFSIKIREHGIDVVNLKQLNNQELNLQCRILSDLFHSLNNSANVDMNDKYNIRANFKAELDRLDELTASASASASSDEDHSISEQDSTSTPTTGFRSRVAPVSDEDESIEESFETRKKRMASQIDVRAHSPLSYKSR
ncbi:hypothetical protein [Candidatus Berkiella aquae]|uniref:Uncharacterized protein n=1 Tax=Candidatus Berkiella aquae TaxID=295108 RepID=A0A0Q9Z0Z6_9GAMM|nr:hypothetical protein [Candidatus Berkiella aquae]MCS5711895.1 hypothetical protein [Candidatus Berkiella aquae]